MTSSLVIIARSREAELSRPFTLLSCPRSKNPSRPQRIESLSPPTLKNIARHENQKGGHIESERIHKKKCVQDHAREFFFRRVF